MYRDAHVHIHAHGYELSCVNLSDCESLEECLRRVAAASSTKMTQCGLPMDTQVMRKVRSSICNSTLTTCSSAGPVMGIWPRVRRGRPMLTRTRSIRSRSLGNSCRVRMPAPVSAVISVFFTRP